MSTVVVTPVYQIVQWQPSPQQQSQTVALSVDGSTLTLVLTVRWNAMAGYWVMTIQDHYGNLVLDSIPLVTGYFPQGNILAQYAYLEIGSCTIVSASPNPSSDYPASTNLGTEWVMVWGSTPAQGG